MLRSEGWVGRGQHTIATLSLGESAIFVDRRSVLFYRHRKAPAKIRLLKLDELYVNVSPHDG
jgi:hypothetical protein